MHLSFHLLFLFETLQLITCFLLAISFARSLQKFPEDFKLLPIDINTPAPKPAPKLRRSSSALPPTPKLTSPYRLKASSATELSSLILQTKGSSQIMPDKTGASLQLNLTGQLSFSSCCLVEIR